MSYKESDIKYELPNFFVLERGKGHYEVMQTKATHSIRRDIIHYSDDPQKALRLAEEKAFDRELTLFKKNVDHWLLLETGLTHEHFPDQAYADAAESGTPARDFVADMLSELGYDVAV